MASSGINHDFLEPPPSGEHHLGTLGHYRVEKQLGKGGMGYVFLAEDTRLKRQVALKVMNQRIAATPGSRKRFISEARAMAAVHHDNVATIFEVGEKNGTPFMAMELLEGSTLENYRERNGEPDYKTIIRYARDIARGLAAAHAQGIVHRDIKPANIWLDTKTDRIKILDFGLALASTPVDQLSGRGAVVGTPGYLSPEQARSEPLDDRCDLYCAGVVLYELATGSLPLKSKTVAEQLIAILAHEPQPLRERNENIPEPLAEMIHRLMAKEPRERFSSATELEAALDRVEEECEKKSEVAQAINQLQLGLEKAVSKKQGNDVLGSSEMDQSAPNPFESLPDAIPAAPLAGTPLAGTSPAANPLAGTTSATAGNLSGGNASGAHPALSMPHSTAAKPGAGNVDAATSQSNSKVILIAAGVCAAILLIVIPLVVFLSDSSAIARQQNTNVLIDSPDPAATPAPKAKNSTNNNRPHKPQKQQNKTPTPNQDNQSRPRARQITKVNAREVKAIGGQGTRWLLGNKQANGSFEQGNPNSGDGKMPGWTAITHSGSGGWKRNPNARNPEAKTYAYADSGSEVTFQSASLKYQTKAGDRFRVALSIGGEGQGKSNYSIVLGFSGNDGSKTRYELVNLDNGSKWTGGNQKRLQYEYAVDGTVDGKRPFLEITLSNQNQSRQKAMMDRVVVTVKPYEAGPQEGNKPATNSVAKSTPPPIALPTTKPEPATPEPPAPTPNPSPKNVPPPESKQTSLRQIEIATSDAGGADTTAKRGTSSQLTLGDKNLLTVQTRNDRQIQHVYLRFPLNKARGGNSDNNRNGQGNKKKPPSIPVETAEIDLQLSPAKRDSVVTLRVYGIGDSVSDVWPENKLNWSNSLSVKGVQTIPMLTDATVKPDDTTVSISGGDLAKFVASASGQSVTFVLTGSGGNELLNILSKEDSPTQAPKLKLGLSR